MAYGMSHRLPTALHTPKEARQRTAVQMLLAEHGMGELFKVISFVKSEWFDALGFSQGDRTHML